MTERLEIHCGTGEVQRVPLTTEEETTRAAAQVSVEAAAAALQIQQSERTAATVDLRAQAAAMTTALDAITARNGTFTPAQAGQALDALAKGQKRLLRLLEAQLG